MFPTRTTSFSIPAWSSRDALRVTRPAESSSVSNEPPAKKRVSLRRSALTGFRSARKLFVNESNASGVQIATQGSSHFARTTPPEKAARKRGGMFSRFFASSEYSN